MRPTILVIDDLQWADQASITLWGRLARSAQQVPLLLIGITRPMPQRDDVLALRRVAGDATRLELAGLTEAAVTELVAELAGGRPDDDLLRLADGAAGNPLYVTELVAALARGSGLSITEAGAAELAGGPVPGSLSAAIADRLGFVTGPVREVLRAAALLGVDFAVADLAVVLDRSVADLIPAVDEACAVGVLAESGRGLGFRHPLIRAALYDDMPASVRAAWHRDAGRALAEAGAPADRVARQLLRAVDRLRRPGRASGRVDAGLAGAYGGAAGRPGAGGGGRTSHPGRGQHLRPIRRSTADWRAGSPTRSTALVTGRGRAGGQPRAGARGRARSPRGPALDAGPVPHAAGRVA